MTASASARGTSVADMLDQAEDLLYASSQNAPSGNRLLAAWPAYAAACARLTVAAVGPRAASHAAAARREDTDPVLVAGLRLEGHIRRASLALAGAVPDPAMLRVTQVIGGAADLIECAHDRPGTWLRDAAQSDEFRRAGIIRAAELALTGVDLTIRACGRTHQRSPLTSPNTTERLTSRAAPLFTTRRYIGAVLDAAESRPVMQALSDVQIPVAGPVPTRDPLDRLHVALRDWRRASLESAHTPAVSSAELQRASVEARQVIALAAALTDAAKAVGLLADPDAKASMAQLQRAGGAWSSVTDGWTRFTTGIPPGHHHVQAALELQSAIRAITRAADGAWLPPELLAQRIDLPSGFEVVHRGLGDVVDVARAHQEAVRHAVALGHVFAHAKVLPLTEERVAARLLGRHMPVTNREGAGLCIGYDDAVERTVASHFTAADLTPRRIGCSLGQRAATRPRLPTSLGM